MSSELWLSKSKFEDGSVIPERMKYPGLYIHIPFCRSKCGYCDFYSETGFGELPRFLNSISSEMMFYEKRFETFDTVYFGGGTPSVLRLKELEIILDSLNRYFDFTPDREMTLEVNPADLDQGYLRALKDLGFNRLNIGVQSFDPSVLRFLGRRHSAAEAESSIHAARKAGFANVGIDLIYGVPVQDRRHWMETLNRALRFDPEHLSCYQLTLPETTPLGRWAKGKRDILPDERSSLRFFYDTANILESAGYVHYEVSNFAKDASLASRHNQKYWDHSPYLGLGPGAHSFSGITRWWNRRSVKEYADDLESGKLPVEGNESLSPEDLALEALFLGLRTKKGICLDVLTDRYRLDLRKDKPEMIRLLEEEGLIHLAERTLVPTLKGLSVADSLALI